MKTLLSWTEAPNAKGWAFNNFKDKYGTHLKYSLIGIVLLSFPYLFFSLEQLNQFDYVLFSIFGYLLCAILPLGFVLIWSMVKFDIGQPTKFYVTNSALYAESHKHEGEYELKFMLNDVQSVDLKKIEFENNHFYQLTFIFKPLRTIKIDQYQLTLSSEFVSTQFNELKSIIFSGSSIKQMWSESMFID